uniref:Poly [ADP-ribose] polymerase n=1 Tax=Hirondellea gigas TaxID=1518452 RepID=A0A6A7G868_9CRUS
MAPKKRQTAQPKGNKRVKASKTDDDDVGLPRCDSENTQLRKAITAVQDSVKSEPKGTCSTKLDYLFDSELTGVGNSGAKIHEDYACMLNQTDVINNNNKFYLIQLAEYEKEFHVFTRWGRVGETGQNSIACFSEAEEAVSEFTKKFTQKTGNKWQNRDNFAAKPKKYTLLAMDEDDTEEEAVVVKAETSAAGKNLVKKTVVSASGLPPCSLPYRTMITVQLIFSDDMFNGQMTEMNLDVRKMPLGKLSKVQIAKGLDVLIQLEEAVKNSEDKTTLADLTSKFFTLVPHSFGRTRPPLLDNAEVIKQKKDVMITLSDIELTQSLQKHKNEPVPKHPMDEKYESLNCKLELLDSGHDEYQVITSYVKGTTTDQNWKLLDVWCIDREGEEQRFRVNDSISARKLLWHGTSVAVVAAILNSGLRIMPHSGGCVGSGIYFASEHSKSLGYAGCHYGTFAGEKNTGFMFLSEVVLGRSKEIMQIDGSIKKAPAGYDSVVARGRKEPDPKKNTTITFDGRKVTVPVGKPIPQQPFKDSNFGQSEYLVYNEHQVRLRFLLKFSR